MQEFRTVEIRIREAARIRGIAHVREEESGPCPFKSGVELGGVGEQALASVPNPVQEAGATPGPPGLGSGP